MTDTAMEALAGGEEEEEDLFDAELEITLDDGSKLSVGDLMGTNADNIARRGIDVVPTGFYHFTSEKPEVSSYEDDDENNVLIITLPNRVKECRALQDDTLNPEDYRNDVQRQPFFIRNAKDMGKLLFFIEQAGCVARGSPRDILFNTWPGTEFTGPVFTRPRKKDKDRYDANIQIMKVRPAAGDPSELV